MNLLGKEEALFLVFIGNMCQFFFKWQSLLMLSVSSDDSEKSAVLFWKFLLKWQLRIQGFFWCIFLYDLWDALFWDYWIFMAIYLGKFWMLFLFGPFKNFLSNFVPTNPKNPRQKNHDKFPGTRLQPNFHCAKTYNCLAYKKKKYYII